MRARFGVLWASAVLAGCSPSVGLEDVQEPQEQCPMDIVDVWLQVDPEVVAPFGYDEAVCIRLNEDGSIQAKVDGTWYSDGLPQWACEGPTSVRILDYGTADVFDAGPECWYVEAETWWGLKQSGYLTPC